MNKYFLCTPEAIRTPDLQLRRLSLYPAELRAHFFLFLLIPLSLRSAGFSPKESFGENCICSLKTFAGNFRSYGRIEKIVDFYSYLLRVE